MQNMKAICREIKICGIYEVGGIKEKIKIIIIRTITIGLSTERWKDLIIIIIIIIIRTITRGLPISQAMERPNNQNNPYRSFHKKEVERPNNHKHNYRSFHRKVKRPNKRLVLKGNCIYEYYFTFSLQKFYILLPSSPLCYI